MRRFNETQLRVLERLKAGEDIDALAAEFDITPGWLTSLADEFNARREPIERQHRIAKPVKTHQRVLEFFDAGKFAEVIALETGISITNVYSILRKYRPNRTRKPYARHDADALCQRNEDMKNMFIDGGSLKTIGKKYGLSGERVRQILHRQHGLKYGDGGAAVGVWKKWKRHREQENHRSIEKWGCSRIQFLELFHHPDKPTGVYSRYRANHRRSAAPFDLTLWQWWTLWQESGHWNERERFYLRRVDKNRGFSVDNLEVAPWKR